jgi:CO/xanthine dehydrogenase FAD-binding subunit
MKPAAFDYIVPGTLEEATAALAAGSGEAKVLAGGQSLVPMLNFRLLKPAILVDINRIPSLAFIKEERAVIRVGAVTRHRQLEISPIISRHLPVLSEAMTYVAHLAIRNRGTFGGSLSHADPAAELPMMAMLLDAELAIVSRTKARRVAARDFFQNALTVDLAHDEIVSEIVLPKLAPGTGWGFEEVSRRAGDFALAATAVTITLSDDAVSEARIAVTGMGSKPLRMSEAEARLVGHALDAELIAQASTLVRARVEPNTDLHASSDYRRHLLGVLVGRALEAAWRRARDGTQGCTT